jgi:dihydrodipicolinate synthase/N-acetylneuraminate lyase
MAGVREDSSMQINPEAARPNRRAFLGSVAGVAAAAGSQTRPLERKPHQPFRGIFTIPCTTFRPDGEIDIPSFRRQIDFCVECGAHGLVFPVNASEWTALSDDERIRLDQVLVEQNAGRTPVVIGVAASAAENAARFAAHAREIGADAVIALPPRGVTDMSVIFDYYRRISEAARLPVFVQNHDAPIGTPLSPEFLIRLCRELEYVKYIKEETSSSGVKMTAVLAGGKGICNGIFGGAGGRYLVEEHRRGCSGQMPGCHVTDVEVAFWNALEQGDEARYMHIYKELAPLFFFESQTPAYKEVLYRRGVISCPLRRNGAVRLDAIASRYLDKILKDLEPLMTWRK